jgi:uncharacterized membrane protein
VVLSHGHAYSLGAGGGLLFILPFWKRGGAKQFGEAQPGRDGDSALDIRKKRYARGEINKEEYEQIKKDII